MYYSTNKLEYNNIAQTPFTIIKNKKKSTKLQVFDKKNTILFPIRPLLLIIEFFLSQNVSDIQYFDICIKYLFKIKQKKKTYKLFQFWEKPHPFTLERICS
ncbi:MAG: hypothetical protein ACQESM_01785 [Bacteroidota bacterium]